MSPDGLKLAYVGYVSDDYSYKLCVGDLSTFGFDCVSESSYHFPLVELSLFAPNSHLLTVLNSNTRGQNTSFVDTSTSTTILVIPDPNDRVEAVAISSDGSYIAYSTPSGQIYIWDMRTGTLAFNFSGHEMISWEGGAGSVRQMSFSPQSNLLVTIGYDDTTRLWDISTGKQLRLLNVCCYAGFTADGRYLVTAGNGMIQAWGISP